MRKPQLSIATAPEGGEMLSSLIVQSCVSMEQTGESRRLRMYGDAPQTFFERLRGLIARKTTNVFIFDNCNAIHTIGMTHAIDVAFVSSKGMVMKVIKKLAPWRFAQCKGARYTLERISSESVFFERNRHVDFLLPQAEERICR